MSEFQQRDQIEPKQLTSSTSRDGRVRWASSIDTATQRSRPAAAVELTSTKPLSMCGNKEQWLSAQQEVVEIEIDWKSAWSSKTSTPARQTLMPMGHASQSSTPTQQRRQANQRVQAQEA